MLAIKRMEVKAAVRGRVVQTTLNPQTGIKLRVKKPKQSSGDPTTASVKSKTPIPPSSNVSGRKKSGKDTTAKYSKVPSSITTTPKIANLLTARSSEEPEDHSDSSRPKPKNEISLVTYYKTILKAASDKPSGPLADAIGKFVEAANNDPFTNRQRFPTTLKYLLKTVCDTSMQQTLDYEKIVLSLESPDSITLDWTPSSDLVDIAGTYHKQPKHCPITKLLFAEL